MLPFQRNKIDISKLNPQEQQLFAKYGKLPTHKSVLMKMQKDRKFFDSGDYALSKAGVAPQSTVGTAIPNPENIPHASNPNSNGQHGHQSLSISPTNSTSPVNKESGLAHDENTSVPEDDQMQADSEAETKETTKTIEVKAAQTTAWSEFVAYTSIWKIESLAQILQLTKSFGTRHGLAALPRRQNWEIENATGSFYCSPSRIFHDHTAIPDTTYLL